MAILSILSTVQKGRIMQMASPLATGWTGWYRGKRRQRWRLVIQTDSEGDALDKLLSLPPGDKIVLPAGRDPNEDRRRS